MKYNLNEIYNLNVQIKGGLGNIKHTFNLMFIQLKGGLMFIQP